MTQQTPEPDSRYCWYSGSHQFSGAEIEQIIRLVKDWANGWQYERPIDKRRLSRETLRYGLSVGLLEYRGLDSQGSTSPFRSEERVYYKRHSHFEPSDSLPPEALWRIFRREIFQDRAAPNASGGFQGHPNQGYSITKSPGWESLNIFHRREFKSELPSSIPDQTDMMIRTICRLQNYGYLIFQYGGSIWEVTLT